MGGGGGGLCDFSVTPSPNWTFGFLTTLGFGLGGLDFGLGLDNLYLLKLAVRLSKSSKLNYYSNI